MPSPRINELMTMLFAAEVQSPVAGLVSAPRVGKENKKNQTSKRVGGPKKTRARRAATAPSDLSASLILDKLIRNYP